MPPDLTRAALIALVNQWRQEAQHNEDDARREIHKANGQAYFTAKNRARVYLTCAQQLEEAAALLAGEGQLVIRCATCSREIWQGAPDYVTLGQARTAKCSDCVLVGARPAPPPEQEPTP